MHSHSMEKYAPKLTQEYQKFEEVFVTFDINSIGKCEGPLYHSFYNYYSSNILETSFSNVAFDSLTVCEKVHTFVPLTCCVC